MHFINILPVFPSRPEFAVAEIRRQRRETGLRRFALSLSFHPEGTPASDKARILCDLFARVREALRRDDIELGALIQSTQGHGWSGRVPLTREPWQRTVLLDGAQTQRMCLLDPRFRQYVCEAVAGVVRAGAKFLLMDDDFGFKPRECFCPLHTSAFNRLAGTDFTSEQLRALIRERPLGDPLVTRLSLQNEKDAETFAAEIRRAIDEVDPTVRCGMCAPWNGHGFLDAVTHAFAGGTEPFVRINNAIYGTEQCLRSAYFHITWQTHNVKHQLHGVRDLIAEADTFPQNYYSVSATAFHAHLTVGVLNGLCGAKLWTSEFTNPVDVGSQRRYERVLAENTPFYDALREAVAGIRWGGVKGPVFQCHERQLHPSLSIGCLVPPEWNSRLLGPLGFPIDYADLSTERGGVWALSREVVPFLSDDEIRTALSSAALVDGGAARLLSARGFAQDLGVFADAGGDDFHFTVEASPASGIRQGMMWEPSMTRLEPVADGVRVLTEFARYDRYAGEKHVVAPAITLFANALGGRVAVTGWDADLPFYKSFRWPTRSWLEEALDFLAGGVFEFSVPAGHQVFVRHGTLADGASLLAVVNLAGDILPDVPVRLEAVPKSVSRLSPGGIWEPVGFSHEGGLLHIAVPMGYLEPIVFRIERS